MIKNLIAWIAGIVLFFLALCTAVTRGQNTGPSAVGFAAGTYQTAAGNISGTALDWYGWSPAKRSYLRRPIRVRALVESMSGTSATWWYRINYYGVVDTLRYTGTKNLSFWIPDSSSARGKGLPDSLFKIVPDSVGMAVNDEFYISSSKVRAGDIYNFRLIFTDDTVKGTAALASQPVWIGDGVSNLVFGYRPEDTVAAVYRAQYSTAFDGLYTWTMSSDTLADSAWTVDSTLAGAWNYRTVTGVDKRQWMKIERIGQSAEDTVRILAEDVIIRSE